MRTLDRLYIGGKTRMAQFINGLKRDGRDVYHSMVQQYFNFDRSVINSYILG